MVYLPDFSRYVENLSLNPSPTRRETLNFPPSCFGKGARGLGQSLAFPHDVKSQVYLRRAVLDVYNYSLLFLYYERVLFDLLNELINYDTKCSQNHF